MVEAIAKYVPANYGTYYEPFLGGGSLFFALSPPDAVLGDSSLELMEVYSAVKEQPLRVASLASQWTVDRDSYYRVRSLVLSDPYERAARFLYLNRTAWNSLWRVNSRGEFNVPFGRPKTSNIVAAETLTACSLALGNADLVTGDFAESVKPVRPGDFVYFDPPYVTGHNNNGFIDYNEVLFSWEDQKRLAGLVTELAKSGVHVVVTNADHHEIRHLYARLNVHVVTRYSTLAGSPAHRRSVRELIISSARSG